MISRTQHLQKTPFVSIGAYPNFQDHSTIAKITAAVVEAVGHLSREVVAAGANGRDPCLSRES